MPFSTVLSLAFQLCFQRGEGCEGKNRLALPPSPAPLWSNTITYLQQKSKNSPRVFLTKPHPFLLKLTQGAQEHHRAQHMSLGCSQLAFQGISVLGHRAPTPLPPTSPIFRLLPLPVAIGSVLFQAFSGLSEQGG